MDFTEHQHLGPCACVILLEFNANTISIKIINIMKLQFHLYVSVDTKTQPNKNDDRPYKPPLQSRAQWAG